MHIVFTPFLHVAAHVVQTKGIRQFPAHGLGAARAVVAVTPRIGPNLCVGQIVAPVEARLCARTARILPLRLTGQPQCQRSLATAHNMRVQGCDEILRIIPRNKIGGIGVADPVGSGWRELRPRTAHRQPLLLRQLVLAHPEPVRQRHRMLRVFNIRTLRFARIPSHLITARRHPHQFERHIPGKQYCPLLNQNYSVTDRRRFTRRIAQLEVHRLHAAFDRRKREGGRRVIGLPGRASEIAFLAGHIFRRAVHRGVVQRHHRVCGRDRVVVDCEGCHFRYYNPIIRRNQHLRVRQVFLEIVGADIPHDVVAGACGYAGKITNDRRDGMHKAVRAAILGQGHGNGAGTVRRIEVIVDVHLRGRRVGRLGHGDVGDGRGLSESPGARQNQRNKQEEHPPALRATPFKGGLGGG
ncbi:MAG: hypothetical protein BWX80_00719 [Candidatus Hydrogenedentes bacterium ADurb.Bin101]|nr:MAG: hypothetical protein BWX80_00719 [Candidatus Hydrogenedentes bacterium ADurb.Bin101]